MSQSERLEKLRSKHLTVNKTYPPYIEYKNVVVDYEAINPIRFEDLEKDIIRMDIRDGSKSSPVIYKNIKTNQYYIHGHGGKFRKCLFDITDNYDWNKVLQENLLKEEFKTKEVKHLIPIVENKIYYPGTPQYDSKYPPVK